MTSQQAKALAPVVAAWGEGRVVQFRCATPGPGAETEWQDYQPSTNGIEHMLYPHRTVEWRIKPTPVTPREWWICPMCGDSYSFNPKSRRCHGGTHGGHSPTPCVHVREVVEGAEPAQTSMPPKEGEWQEWWVCSYCPRWHSTYHGAKICHSVCGSHGEPRHMWEEVAP